jgi:hypothetical protein
MMNKKMLIPFLPIAMLLLASCAPVSVAKANSQPNLENTQPAVTATGIIPVTISTLFPTATETPALSPPQAPTQVPTLLPTATPIQTLAPIPVPVPCNLAAFVGDVTIPDSSIINPGDTFTKTWRLQNIGACSWTPNYALVFLNGDLMSGPTIVQLPENVNPGGTIDLSISLVAPPVPGTYQGYWMLRDSNGRLFGVGANGSQPFWVAILVNSSTAFMVTELDESVAPSSYVGACPATITFNANIWTNDTGSVTYYWQRSDGSTSLLGTISYTGGGIQTVSDALTLGTPGVSMSGWDQIYIVQPNQQAFTPISFNLTCSLPTSTATIAPTQPPTPTQTPTLTQPAPTQTPTLTQTPTPTQPAPTPSPAPSQTSTSNQTPTPTPTPSYQHS